MQRYRDRISGPLLDRIDLHLEVPSIQYAELTSKKPGESSAAMRDRVIAARQRQRERFAGANVTCNARMSSKLLKAYCELDSQSEGLLHMAMTQLNLSARTYDR
ncbi:MAG: magnesium chelatase, partial [Lacunisphaera sp.]|nr:magnesium chelatase [Lacunisphaera sp.]